MEFPRVFVVILNYNGRQVLKKCLASLFRVQYPGLEVVLVDNGSEDGSFEAAKADFSRAHFIKNEYNLGFSAGNNVGIRYALEKGADYVLLLNYDTEVEPDFLKKLVQTSQNNPQAGVFSPLILGWTKKRIWFAGGKVCWLVMKARHSFSAKDDKAYSTGFISGCAMLVKKEVFSRVGLLDEDFFLYWEDVDFSVRARRSGFGLQVSPESRVYHFEKSEEKKKNKVYWLVISGLIFFKKNAPWYLWSWIRIYVFLRKLKNRWELRYNRNEISEAVGKAYRDFEKYVQR